MEKRIIAIGGGEIKSRQTLEIDRYIAALAKYRALESGKERATALFIGTASHDSLPYFNSFRKTYTSVFNIKAEVVLCVNSFDYKNVKEKFLNADMVYVGGGDTKFMLDTWAQKGLTDLILNSYNKGVVLAGLSAGAIAWFENMYTDYDIIRGEANEYRVLKGLGLIKGIVCPHYNVRPEFDTVVKDFDTGYALEDNCAIEFIGGAAAKSISAGGSAYTFKAGEKAKI